MQTVTQAIEIATYVMGTSRQRANQIARAILNAGMLPKSAGRDLKKIDAAQLLPLLAAIAMADKIVDAPVVAKAFAELPAQMGERDSDEEIEYFPQVFARVMNPNGAFKKAAIEFTRTPAGFTANIRATIASSTMEMQVEIPFWKSFGWGGFSKTSFTISAEGVSVMRNLFARADLDEMSFKLASPSSETE